MRCSTVKKNLSARKDGELEAPLAAEIEAHLASCRACSQLAARYAAVDHALDGLPQPEPSASFDDGFRAKLRASRQQQARQGQKASRRRWFSLPLFAGAAATAAAAVFAVVLIGHLRPDDRQPPAVSNLVLAQHLDLLRNYDVVKDLDVLEDFDAVESLDTLTGEGQR